MLSALNSFESLQHNLVSCCPWTNECTQAEHNAELRISTFAQ